MAISKTCMQKHYPNISVSSSVSYTRTLQSQPNFIPQTQNNHRAVSVSVSVSVSMTRRRSQSHTVSSDHCPPLKWNEIYKKISVLGSENGNENVNVTESVLNQWERDRHTKPPTKWELSRIVKELRKYKRYHRALQVYDWMDDRRDRFKLTASDSAILLDLISKVCGISCAENFFLSLSNRVDDMKIYGAMLNAYVWWEQKEKAESLFHKMRTKGYASHYLPFSVMMKLYMNLKDYQRVEALVSEMMEEKVQLDLYSYNIWLACLGSQGSAEGMERAYEQMRLDDSVDPNCSTFTSMATMYIKMGIFEKAEDCLRKAESRIQAWDWISYNHLLSLYGSIGNKEEIYRIWNVYKAGFPNIPNLGYYAIVSSLVRIGDVKSAEKIYEEWMVVKSSYDPRIANLLMGYYVNNGNLDKAKSFFYRIAEVGGKPDSGTWEMLAMVHIVDRKIFESLLCWKEAFAAEGVKNWKPNPVNVSDFFDLCDQEADLDSKQVLEGLLNAVGYLEHEIDGSQIGLPHEAMIDNEIFSIEG